MMTNTSHSSNPTNSGGSKNKKKFNQKTHKHQGGDGNERRKPSFKGLAQDGAMKGVVITQERSLAGQIKPFIDAVVNQISQLGHSMVSDCIKNKKALEDDDELFVATPPNTSKWAIKVQVPCKGHDGTLKYHKKTVWMKISKE